MRQVMIIVNPKAGKGNAKANLFTLCNAFCAMEDEVKVFVTPVSYTHLDVYKRQVSFNASCTALRISFNLIIFF